MKKLFVCLLMIIGLVGCSGKPVGMSDDDYNVCKNIIEVHEDYLSGNITEDEAREKLYRMSNLIEDSDNHNVKMISIIAEQSAQEMMSAFDVDADSIKSNRDEIKNYLK